MPHRLGRLGAPVLDECFAHFECRVANVMDTGSSTCFLGDVVEVGHGAAAAARGAVMTAVYFREHMPTGWRKDYEDHLKEAQRFAEQRSRDIRAVHLQRRSRPSDDVRGPRPRTRGRGRGVGAVHCGATPPGAPW